MAPILTTSTGHPPQVLDDPRLRDLLEKSNGLPHREMNTTTIATLVDLLSPFTDNYYFQEQIDLYHWIHPLNVVDAALAYLLRNYSKHILLVEPNKDPERFRSQGYHNIPVATPPLDDITCAATLADISQAPTVMTSTVLPQLTVLLKFTALLLRNATSKSIYQSVHYMVDLLAAADDKLADLALTVLYSLSLPVAVHKQQTPEQGIHTTVLRQVASEHARIVAMARGWGTRAMGLGLVRVLTADDSGHDALPVEPGEVRFTFDEKELVTDGTNQPILPPRLLEIKAAEMMRASADGDSTNKRRKVAIETKIKSTAEIFFDALDKAKSLPSKQQFALLTDIRLARSFHASSLRQAAIERRLQALITILHSHPTQEVIVSYFSAHPELCLEIVDLLRPMVSSANMTNTTTTSASNFPDAIAGLVTGGSYPYSVRMLAVEALTALALRRDGMSSLISGSGRLNNVLVDMGVGKGQYLGVIPTLIRYSLAALASASQCSPPIKTSNDDKNDDIDAMDVGVAFVEATLAPQPPRVVQVCRALEFIDNVLTLIAAVVATGTSALVDSGLVPALLTTVSIDPDQLVDGFSLDDDDAKDTIRTLFCFVVSQAVQILESVIVSHSNAMSAFQDLGGVELLVERLAKAMAPRKDSEGNTEMTDHPTTVFAAQRVLLFGLFTCLTVVFHQESSNTEATTTAGGTQLRKPELSNAVIQILNDPEAHGGQLVALVCTMLTDIMNNDPHVVHHVHDCGIAASFLGIIMGRQGEDGHVELVIPPVPELIMALPNVIAALSLTDAGATAVQKANPFPSLLRILYDPRYAMPQSRCLLNEMMAIVGTGIDEILRHVEKLRPQILTSVAQAMNEVVALAHDLARCEEQQEWNEQLDDRRTCLMQYVMNFAQILEQLFHHEDRSDPFVEAGGLDALIEIFPASMPAGHRFLAHVSGMSAPSVGTLHHATLEEMLSTALRCILERCLAAPKVFEKIGEAARRYLAEHKSNEDSLVQSRESVAIEQFPAEAFIEGGDEAFLESTRPLARYLRGVSSVQWITNVAATAIQVGKDVDQEARNNRIEHSWLLEVTKEPFRSIVNELCLHHRCTIRASCAARTQSGYDQRELQRQQEKSRSLRYRLRIVCVEGAVVRNGIEIDTCANVGNMEMGEMVEAYDRCINASGILRYRTARGWVSEMTRGHGREAISELVSVWDGGVDFEFDASAMVSTQEAKKRIEAGLPDLRSVAAGVLARGQSGYTELLASLSKLAMAEMRTVSGRILTFADDSKEGRLASIVGLLGSNLKLDLDEQPSKTGSTLDDGHRGTEAISLYRGFVFHHLTAILFERRSVNFPLLVNLVGDSSGSYEASVFRALRQVLHHALSQFADCTHARVKRSVAASLPPMIALLRKILNTPLALSPLGTAMSRMKEVGVKKWVSLDKLNNTDGLFEDEFFQPDAFSRKISLDLSTILKEMWLDDRIRHAPSFLLHPILSLVGDIIDSFAETVKKKSTGRNASSRASGFGRRLLSDVIRRQDSEANSERDFEPSEDAVTRLMEMGFSRDHALDALENVRSNRLEVAMDYALTHPPPDSATVERRRAERARARSERDSSLQNEREASTEENAETTNGRPANDMDIDSDAPAQRSSNPVRDDGLEVVKKTFVGWIHSFPERACTILIADKPQNSSAVSSASGNAEMEAAAVVLTSFLIDFSEKFPEERPSILTKLVQELDSRCTVRKEDSSSAFSVQSQVEAPFSALCHAITIFVRAFPNSRYLILEFDVVTKIRGCIESTISDVGTTHVLPSWIAPSMLLLDTMAQPLISSQENFFQSPVERSGGDLSSVQREHETKRSSLSKNASALLRVISEEDPLSPSEDGQNEEKNELHIPAFFPLVSESTASSCLDICCRILSLHSSGIKLSPTLAHSTLLLLLRLLRSPRASEVCLRSGVAEMILSLSSESRFTGNAGLTTLVLKRLLEDESNLHLSMEIDIRSTILKLSKASGSENKATIQSFFKANTSLICRDPEIFLRAMASSVKLHRDGSKIHVSPLPAKERAQRLEKLSTLFGQLRSSSVETQEGTLERPKKRGSPGKTRSPLKAVKSHKKKKDKYGQARGGVHESPEQHIAALLISIASSDISESVLSEEGGFLFLHDVLGIVADLVLAQPAFASSVLNYRYNRNKKVKGSVTHISHALHGSPSPSKNFISFLLHTLLPLERWHLRLDIQLWDRENEPISSALKDKKERAYRLTKTTQASSRVLAALVARPGEGRKRVICDLAFALSGGRVGHRFGRGSEPDMIPSDSFSRELCALNAWGELCLGFAAPRSNGRNVDATSVLSVETLRAMLECGMVHALLFALKRVDTLHQMGSNTCSMLLKPLEILTRPAVTSATKILVAKDASRSDGRESNAGIEDDRLQNSQLSDGVRQEHADDEQDFHNHSSDLHMAEQNESENDRIDSEIDESIESDSSDEIMEDDDEIEDSDTSEDTSDEIDEEGEWVVDEAEGSYIFDEDPPPHGYDEEDNEADELNRAVDEGWTRIDPDMLLGRRAGVHRGAGLNGLSQGAMHAAEAMVGNLLRSGDVSREMLAEIEESLGIRIVPTGRGVRGDDNGFSGDMDHEGDSDGGNTVQVRVATRDSGGTSSADTSDLVGTVPHVHQRSRPDVGYSAYGRTGQWSSASPMEFVFGGQAVSSGNRNYILGEREETVAEETPGITQLDLQLFPGGPASAARARTQYALHPLLCGVDLPPVNSLASDLLPSGERAARYGQMQTRRPGEWMSTPSSNSGYLAATSNGNIIRANRMSALGSLFGTQTRTVAGPIGWTDDGLPVDSSVEDFIAVFERSLEQSLRENQGSGGARDGQRSTREPQNQNEEDGTTRRADEGDAPNGSEPSRPASEGDRVEASLASIANNLRLSSESEAAEGNEPSTNLAEREESENVHVPNDAAMDTVESASSTNNDLAVESTNNELAVEGSSDGNDAMNTDALEAPASASIDRATGGENMDCVEEEEMRRRDVTDGVTTDTSDTMQGATAGNEPDSAGLVCPPDVDPEVFNSLPEDMQRDCVAQYSASQELAAQLDGSTLDPEVLAALPEDMRREVLEQDRRERERSQRQEAPADPAHAEEMDNASFIASLAPELREEVLLTADEAVLRSLPPNILAEAQILRERASARHRGYYNSVRASGQEENHNAGGAEEQRVGSSANRGPSESLSRRRQRSGKIRVEADSEEILYIPESLSPPIAMVDVKVLLRLLFLATPIRPSRLLQKLLQNLCMDKVMRQVIASSLIFLLNNDLSSASAAVESLSKSYEDTTGDWRREMDSLFGGRIVFPPRGLIGGSRGVPDESSLSLHRPTNFSNQEAAPFDVASTLADGARSGTTGGAERVPSLVSSRLIDTVMQLCKHSSSFALHLISSEGGKATSLEELVGLLGNPLFSDSSSNLEQLLNLLECAVAPLSHLPKHAEEETEISEREMSTASEAGKEWVAVPRVELSPQRLRELCGALRMETCRESSFTKVNTIVRRLCRVEANRGFVLSELAVVAHGLGLDAIRDLRNLKVRLDAAMTEHKHKLGNAENGKETSQPAVGAISSSITVATSTSEIKLLRVLQTLQALCNDSDESGSKKNEGSVLVTDELVHLLRQMEFDTLWDELSSCLAAVQILEGVKTFEEEQEEQETEDNENNGEDEDKTKEAKKLRNSAAGLLTRFLPTVESFFVANASATRPQEAKDDSLTSARDRYDIAIEDLVGGERVIDFVSKNKVLLNALIRNNNGLLDKGLRAMVQVPRCRVLLDFDVKRHWFKTQVRRLRQQASRRHGSLRLHIRRKYVFEDAYHQLRLRNADEMRGRLHITFRNEEGVDAGGLSREFFAILAKEIFNPNYALFTATEDGCTFQPNPNSGINPDHLSYFRFVGRIVGKAVVDGFLLDAHFTRSLYKHMLNMQPSHHDMEAIDPDYYRNLQTILEYNLEDMGLDLTFSFEDHSFGRNQVIDLVENGRKKPVTEENKAEYVRLVCQHRMTTAIKSQIKAYLDGFYELVSADLICVFTPRELELLISGLPDIDVLDLKKNTEYVGWKATDKEIEWFWNILFTLSRNEKAAFLQFVTGSSKVPLAGFSELQGMRGTQKFSIHQVSRSRKGALMSAHTCFNSLDLPSYSSEEEMKEKLLLAINEGGGAFLFA